MYIIYILKINNNNNLKKNILIVIIILCIKFDGNLSLWGLCHDFGIAETQIYIVPYYT